MNEEVSSEALISAQAIDARIGELADAINERYAGEALMLLVTLKGAAPFSGDLARKLRVPLTIEYIRARSYAGTERAGEVVFSHLPEESLEGRHVLIVEDILDTGHTARRILQFVHGQSPVSVALAVLLDKPSRRQEAVEADFVGFTIDDHFVIGYGLDFNERYRELDAIYTLEPGD